jgi:hypothetical protein
MPGKATLGITAAGLGGGLLQPQPAFASFGMAKQIATINGTEILAIKFLDPK